MVRQVTRFVYYLGRGNAFPTTGALITKTSDSSFITLRVKIKSLLVEIIFAVELLVLYKTLLIQLRATINTFQAVLMIRLVSSNLKHITIQYRPTTCGTMDDCIGWIESSSLLKMQHKFLSLRDDLSILSRDQKKHELLLSGAWIQMKETSLLSFFVFAISFNQK